MSLQRALAVFRSCLSASRLSVFMVLVSCLVVSADKLGRQVWTDARMNAMVRVEVFSQDTGASVGSAFLVQGIDRVYVLTSAHVFGKELEDEGEKECVPFSIEVKLYQRERNGEPLEHGNCAWLLGRDLALIPVHERAEGYPTLELRTREFHQWDEIYIAGYPNGYELDTTTAGMVRSVHAVNDLVMTNALSLPGMSGGPYLSESGYTVGLASVHFLIDRDGAVVQLVPANREASHAGRDSRWGEFKGLNRYSVSIDFINMGQLNKDNREGFKDYTGAEVSADDVQAIDGPFETTYWQRFTGPQLAVSQALASELNRHYKIQAIAGHCNVLADRKADPGPAFPIKEFGNTVLGNSEPDCAPVGSRH